MRNSFSRVLMSIWFDVSFVMKLSYEPLPYLLVMYVLYDMLVLIWVMSCFVFVSFSIWFTLDIKTSRRLVIEGTCCSMLVLLLLWMFVLLLLN